MVRATPHEGVVHKEFRPFSQGEGKSWESFRWRWHGQGASYRDESARSGQRWVDHKNGLLKCITCFINQTEAASRKMGLEVYPRMHYSGMIYKHFSNSHCCLWLKRHLLESAITLPLCDWTSRWNSSDLTMTLKLVLYFPFFFFNLVRLGTKFLSFHS